VSSFLKVIDEGIRALLFTKFGDIMGFSSITYDDIVIYPKDIAQRQIAERRETNVIEFANLWRETTSNDWTRQRTAVAREGIHLAYQDGDGPSGLTDEKTSIIGAKAMPVTLEYSVWFWSQHLDRINQVSEEYLFWQQQDPNLSIYYNDLYPLEFDLTKFGEVSDESDLPNMFEVGRVFVIHFPITVEGWIFQNLVEKTIKKIVITVYDENDLSDVRAFLSEGTDAEKENLRLYREIITE